MPTTNTQLTSLQEVIVQALRTGDVASLRAMPPETDFSAPLPGSNQSPLNYLITTSPLLWENEEAAVAILTFFKARGVDFGNINKGNGDSSFLLKLCLKYLRYDIEFKKIDSYINLLAKFKELHRIDNMVGDILVYIIMVSYDDGTINNFKKLELLSVLQGAGMNLNDTNEYNQTALHLLTKETANCEWKGVFFNQAVSWLMQKGANPLICQSNGMDVLRYACYSHSFPMQHAITGKVGLEYVPIFAVNLNTLSKFKFLPNDARDLDLLDSFCTLFPSNTSIEELDLTGILEFGTGANKHKNEHFNLNPVCKAIGQNKVVKKLVCSTLSLAQLQSLEGAVVVNRSLQIIQFAEDQCSVEGSAEIIQRIQFRLARNKDSNNSLSRPTQLGLFSTLCPEDPIPLSLKLPKAEASSSTLTPCSNDLIFLGSPSLS